MDEENELRGPNQLIPGHQLVNGRIGIQIQVYQLQSQVPSASPDWHQYPPLSEPEQNSYKGPGGAQLIFLFSSSGNTGMFWNREWWLPGQGPEQRIVRAGILNKPRARNRGETWKTLVQELSKYQIQVTKEGPRLSKAKWLAQGQERPKKGLSFSRDV